MTPAGQDAAGAQDAEPSATSAPPSSSASSASPASPAGSDTERPARDRPTCTPPSGGDRTAPSAGRGDSRAADGRAADARTADRAAADRRAARRRLDEVFGSTAESSSDERGPGRSADGFGEEWYRLNRPPHHGG